MVFSHLLSSKNHLHYILNYSLAAFLLFLLSFLFFLNFSRIFLTFMLYYIRLFSGIQKLKYFMILFIIIGYFVGQIGSILLRKILLGFVGLFLLELVLFLVAMKICLKFTFVWIVNFAHAYVIAEDFYNLEHTFSLSDYRLNLYLISFNWHAIFNF